MAAESLKPIHKEILNELAKLEGQGAMMRNLMLIISKKGPFNGGDVMRACHWLKEQGLVDINSRNFVIPTKKGEK